MAVRTSCLLACEDHHLCMVSRWLFVHDPGPGGRWVRVHGADEGLPKDGSDTARKDSCDLCRAARRSGRGLTRARGRADDQRPGQEGARGHAEHRRDGRRHVHHLQRRRVRLAAVHAHHQPAAVRHPGHALHQPARGGARPRPRPLARPAAKARGAPAWPAPGGCPGSRRRRRVRSGAAGDACKRARARDQPCCMGRVPGC